MAAAIDVRRFGLHRARRKIRQDFSRAMLRSTGARAADRARLTVRRVGASSPRGGRPSGVVAQGPALRCRRGRRGSADGYAKACGDLHEGVVPAEADQADEGPLVRREFAAAVTLTGDDEHGYPLDQGVRQVECGRIGNQRGSYADELRRRTPLSTAQEPRALRTQARQPISGHSERAHCFVWIAVQPRQRQWPLAGPAPARGRMDHIRPRPGRRDADRLASRRPVSDRTWIVR